MDRKQTLLKLVGDSSDLMNQLIDEIIYMESQLEYYRSLPQIRVNKEKPEIQRATPAAKLYKETLQQYTNCIKIIAKCAGIDADDEESPLRKWAKAYLGNPATTVKSMEIQTKRG